MVGCAVLAAQAALRCGTGLLTLGFPKSLYLTYTRRLTEAMFLPLAETKEGSLAKKSVSEILKFLTTQDVVALGPGLSRNKDTQEVIRETVKKSDCPMVIDADALFPFTGHSETLKKIRKPFILTPHAGEFKRLFGMDGGESLSARKNAAQKAVRICGGVVVLKGHQTVVADTTRNIYVNTTGDPGLAKGGSGDVLLGMIASFLAQGLQAFDAACLGVYLHGLAADLAIRKIPPAALLPTDLLDHISLAMKQLNR